MLSTIRLFHSYFSVIYVAFSDLGNAILEPITSPEWSMVAPIRKAGYHGGEYSVAPFLLSFTKGLLR